MRNGAYSLVLEHQFLLGHIQNIYMLLEVAFRLQSEKDEKIKILWRFDLHGAKTTLVLLTSRDQFLVLRDVFSFEIGMTLDPGGIQSAHIQPIPQFPQTFEEASVLRWIWLDIHNNSHHAILSKRIGLG